MSNEKLKKFGVIAPVTSAGDYAATSADEIQGGYHVVSNETQMTQIPPWLRQLGMEVFVLSTERKYRLKNNPQTTYTALTDWKLLADGVTNETLNSLVTNNELDQTIDNILAKMQATYVPLSTLKQNYLTIENAAAYYQQKVDMRYYLTFEDFNNFGVALSKVVTRIVANPIIRVTQGTQEFQLVLPSSVSVYFGDSQTQQCPVVWNTDNYDPELVGYQTLEGRIIYPDYIDISDNRNLAIAHQIIQVVAKSAEILPVVSYSDICGFGDIEPIEVGVGVNPMNVELPKTVPVKLIDEDGTVTLQRMSVIWNYSSFASQAQLMSAKEVTGDIIITDEDHVTNTLKLQPKQAIIIGTTAIQPNFQYKRSFILPAGSTTIQSDVINRIDHVSANDFYGVNNDLSQRIVDVRFMGLLNQNGVNITPEITDKYPDGIRMPVINSTDQDIEAFLDAIREFDDILGYKLEYEIPGGIINPKVGLDDETHRLSFGSAVMHDVALLIRKSNTVNLPYPDIC